MYECLKVEYRRFTESEYKVMNKWTINQRFPVTGRGWVLILEDIPLDISLKAGTKFIDQNNRCFEVHGIEMFKPDRDVYTKNGIRYYKSNGVLFKPISEYDDSDPDTELSAESVVSE